MNLNVRPTGFGPITAAQAAPVSAPAIAGAAIVAPVV